MRCGPVKPPATSSSRYTYNSQRRFHSLYLGFTTFRHIHFSITNIANTRQFISVNALPSASQPFLIVIIHYASSTMTIHLNLQPSHSLRKGPLDTQTPHTNFHLFYGTPVTSTPITYIHTSHLHIPLPWYINSYSFKTSCSFTPSEAQFISH